MKIDELMDIYDENKTKTCKVIKCNNKKYLSNREYSQKPIRQD